MPIKTAQKLAKFRTDCRSYFLRQKMGNGHILTKPNPGIFADPVVRNLAQSILDEEEGKTGK